MASKIFWSVTPQENICLIKSKGLQPQIGPRSQNQREHRPAIYMFSSKEDMENALMNWLGDEFDDNPIMIMKITLPASYEPFLKNVAFEVQCYKEIPAQYIAFFDDGGQKL